MKSIRKHMSYANVMSTIAVFFVMSGATAVAATQLAKNSVGSKQLKKNAVTSAKIKKNAVIGSKIKNGSITASKIKNGSITGDKLKISSLGTVPQAATISGYQRTGTIRLVATAGADESAARAAAPEAVFFSSGPFTIYAKCFSYNSRVQAETYIRTTEGGSIFDSDNDDLDGDPFLEPGTAEVDRQLIYDYVSSDNTSNLYAVHSSEFLAQAPSGHAVRGDLSVAVKRGTLPGGSQGVYGDGNVCLFTGEATQLNQ